MAARASTAPAPATRAGALPSPARRARPAGPAHPAQSRRRSGPAAAPARRAARVTQPRGALVLDRLLRGRGWVACLFVLLAGIVFFNVSVLELNEGIARTSKRSDEFKRQNSRLRLEVARLESSERIQRAAAELGLMLPAAGDVRYVSTRPRTDARRAARRMRAPQAPAFAVAPAGQTGEAPGGPQAPGRTQAPGEGQAPTGTAQVGGATPADDVATVNGQAPAPAGTAPSPPAAAAP